MPSSTIQWFPGHMAKTRRMMQECLGDVDIIIELADARIPFSSRNPEIQRIVGEKPLLTLYNKSSLSDPAYGRKWLDFYKAKGENSLFTDCVTGDGINRISDAVRTILKEKCARYAEKGMANRRLKAMIVGIPNVGKSTLINRLAGAKKAKAENRPGVTVNKQWVPTSIGLDLLDMPGVLWPRFDRRETGENLAITGAIKDDILATEEIAAILCARLRTRYPALLTARYKLTDDAIRDVTKEELFLLIGKKRGMLIAGGEIDTDRTADMLLTEFRGGKIGKITLETPGEYDAEL